MSTAQEEVANDKVKVQITRNPGCKITFDVSMPAEATQSAYSRAVKSVNKEVSLPGFRKGKAPEKLVLQHYGKYVDREWQNLVVDEAFTHAVELTNIHPLHRDSIQQPNVKKISKEEGAEITLKFESQPTVPDVDVNELSLADTAAKEVTEAEQKKALDDLRLFHADWVEITDRAIKEHDFIDVDIDAVESPAYNICTNERFEVTKDRMPSWMRKLVLGLNIGENAEGVSEKDENFPYNSPTGEFKPTKVRVTIKGIKTASLPEINDELAKKAGVDDVELLKERIAASLKRDHQKAAEDLLYRQIEKQLLEKYTFEVPASILESERQTRVRNRIRGLHTRQASEDEIKQRSAQIEDEARVDAESFVRLYYLLRPIVQKNNLSITQYDMYQELTRQIHQLPVEEQIIEQNMEPELARGKLLALVTTHKGMDYLVGQLRNK
ncbi:MAG: trigger factor [Chlamydiales bacterium]|nr:trigger factor [Chlamydiales bacterium]